MESLMQSIGRILITHVLSAVSIICVISGCDPKPIPLQESDCAIGLSSNIVLSKSYKIPVGIFRGAVQPATDQYFTIWSFEPKETYRYIEAPEGFELYQKVVTVDWKFEIEEEDEFSVIYQALAKNVKERIHLNEYRLFCITNCPYTGIPGRLHWYSFTRKKTRNERPKWQADKFSFLFMFILGCSTFDFPVCSLFWSLE